MRAASRRLGEFSLIAAFTRPFHPPPSPRGPGDDAALLTVRPGAQLVATTDALVEGVHFARATFSFADVGHKALAVNLSDLAAMGARPTAFLCALTVPDDVRDAQLIALAKGMAALARRSGAALVGGNVTRGPALIVTITAVGELPRGAKPLLRQGARPGDRLWVSGALGDAAAGLAHPRPKDAQRRPRPEVALGPRLLGLASACLDVSDGLAQDLGHLAEASGVGLELSAAALPIGHRARTAAKDPSQALAWALHGGEDYVLAFTAPPAATAALRRLARRLRRPLTAIGTAVTRPGLRVDGRPLDPSGFRHR